MLVGVTVTDADCDAVCVAVCDAVCGDADCDGVKLQRHVGEFCKHGNFYAAPSNDAHAHGIHTHLALAHGRLKSTNTWDGVSS